MGTILCHFNGYCVTSHGSPHCAKDTEAIGFIRNVRGVLVPFCKLCHEYWVQTMDAILHKHGEQHPNEPLPPLYAAWKENNCRDLMSLDEARVTEYTTYQEMKRVQQAMKKEADEQALTADGLNWLKQYQK